MWKLPTTMFAVLLLASTGAAQEIEVPEMRLEIGPIPGLTTAWHPAPTETCLPFGSTVLLRARLSSGFQGPAEFSWHGADEVENGPDWSLAELRCHTEGPIPVRVEVQLADGNVRGDLKREFGCYVTAVPVGGIRVSVSEPSVQGKLFEDMNNLQTMKAFFGRESCADLSPVAPGRYVTSVERAVRVEAQTWPEGFEPLVEWRVNERAVAIGRVFERAFDEPGLYTVKHSPTRTGSAPSSSHQTAIFEVYRAHIYEIAPGSYEAQTEPPGYESSVQWLSSTKHGTAEPTLGKGARFQVSFDNTFGRAGSWTGVRADNATVGQDAPFTILDVTPKEAAAGELVRIAGINMDKVIQVDFNGKSSSIVQLSPREITVRVPSGAPNGPVYASDGSYEDHLSEAFVVLQGSTPTLREAALITFLRNEIDGDPVFDYLVVQQSAFPLTPGSVLHPVQAAGTGGPPTPFLLTDEAYLFYVDEFEEKTDTDVVTSDFAHPVRYGLVRPGGTSLDRVFQEEWWPVVNGVEFWAGPQSWFGSPDVVCAVARSRRARRIPKNQQPDYWEINAGRWVEPAGDVRVLLLSGDDNGRRDDELDAAAAEYADRFPGATVTRGDDQSKAEICQQLDQLENRTRVGDTVIIHIAAHASRSSISTRGDAASQCYLTHGALADKIEDISAITPNVVVVLSAPHGDELADDLQQAGYRGIFIHSSSTNMAWYRCRHVAGVWSYTTYFTTDFLLCLSEDPNSAMGRRIDRDADGKISPVEAYDWAFLRLIQC